VVHVVEHQTVPVQVLHGLFEAHVEQHGSVERLRSRLGAGQEKREGKQQWLRIWILVVYDW
jgi:hypothetical protein